MRANELGVKKGKIPGNDSSVYASEANGAKGPASQRRRSGGCLGHHPGHRKGD